jgi:5-methylcytosine-specific restriction endonuclease McrA
MSLAPVIAELMAAGVTGDALVAAVARIEAAQKPERSSAAIRQARYRELRDLNERSWFDLRMRVIKRDGKTCAYCNKKLTRSQISVDHITPVSKGGTNDLSNLAISCRECNSSKSGKMISEWRGVACQ